MEEFKEKSYFYGKSNDFSMLYFSTVVGLHSIHLIYTTLNYVFIKMHLEFSPKKKKQPSKKAFRGVFDGCFILITTSIIKQIYARKYHITNT